MEIRKINVDRLALDGDGIGRLSSGAEAGKVAFVPYSLPGELMECRLLIRKTNLSRWLPSTLLQPSFDRVAPACPYHFKPGGPKRWCGGCNWQHMPTRVQEESKRGLVIETLQRLGGIPTPPVEAMLRSPKDWRYRNKVQVPFGKSGRDVVAGFFAPGSHDIVDFDDCLIQPEESVAIVRRVKKLANDWKWWPYEEDDHRGWLRHLLVRTNAEGQAIVVVVTARPDFRDSRRFVEDLRARFKSVIGIHQNLQPAHTNVILGDQWKKLWGVQKIQESVLGLKLSYSPGAFFQVNTAAAARLYEKALALLDPAPHDVVADLYCGVGAMAILGAKRAAFAVGVESSREAINDAMANAAANGVRNVDFVAAQVEDLFSPRGSRVMEKLSGRQPLVILDPPRAGCAPEVLQAVLRLKPRRIVYVSCHPATLARDLKLLNAEFVLTTVVPVDLFPQTSHIETIARLDRK